MTDNARQSGKVFVGGLSWDTTGEKLRAYFENWGVVREAFVSYNRANGRPRGFGFVVFQDAEVADKVVATKHTIDRREVEAKKAVPKEEQPEGQAGSGAGSGSGGDGGAGASPGGRSRKIFVGGLAPTVDEAALRAHFSAFGPVEDAVVMYDHDNKRPRGFGFVTFATDESVDLVFTKGAMQTIADKQIEIKSAVPRDMMPPSNRGGHGYGGFDPRFAHAAGPRGGLYPGNPYLGAPGMHGQFAGLPLGGPHGRGGYGGPHRGGIVPSAGGPGHPHSGRAPGRYDPTGGAGLGHLPGGFPQQQAGGGMHHAQGMHSQGLGGGGKVPPMGMQHAGGGYGLYGAAANAAALSNGAGAAGGMFAPGSPAALAYNLASLQQQAQAHLNGMAAAGVNPPGAVPQGGAHGQVQAGPGGKLGGPGTGAFGSSAAAGSLSSLKALAMASGLSGAFSGPAGAPGAPGSGGSGDDGGGGFSVQQPQQPSDKDYADAVAANAAAAAAAGLAQVSAGEYGGYHSHDAPSFSTAPAPGWSS